MTRSVLGMNKEMTVAQVANEMKVSERTVRRWIADGVLPARKVVGRVIVDRADVLALSKAV